MDGCDLPIKNKNPNSYNHHLPPSSTAGPAMDADTIVAAPMDVADTTAATNNGCRRPPATNLQPPPPMEADTIAAAAELLPLPLTSSSPTARTGHGCRHHCRHLPWMQMPTPTTAVDADTMDADTITNLAMEEAMEGGDGEVIFADHVCAQRWPCWARGGDGARARGGGCRLGDGCSMASLTRWSPAGSVVVGRWEVAGWEAMAATASWLRQDG
ncbi:hypothetical protein Dimus_019143 [Dionaea muscipula]